MKHILLLTLLIAQAASTNLTAMEQASLSLLQEDETERRKGYLLVLKSKLERLNNTPPATLRVTCDNTPYDLFKGEAEWFKTALFECLDSIHYDATTFCSEEAFTNKLGTTTIDIAPLKDNSLFAFPEDGKMRMLRWLKECNGDFSVVYGDNKLDISTETKIKLVDGLYGALDMLEGTCDTGFVINLAKCGHFPAGIVMRPEETVQDAPKAESSPAQPNAPNAYALIKEARKQEKALEASQTIDEKLALLKVADPDKIFIRALSMTKREPRIDIAQRLASLADAISIDKYGNITLEGPLVEAFAYNAQRTTMEQFVEKTDKSISLSSAQDTKTTPRTGKRHPTLLKRLLHPANLIAMAVVGVVCWHASKQANSTDV